MIGALRVNNINHQILDLIGLRNCEKPSKTNTVNILKIETMQLEGRLNWGVCVCVGGGGGVGTIFTENNHKLSR